MAKKNNYLTGSEEELMELFWSRGEAMTSVEILKTAGSHSWNDSYLHIMLRSLLKKGMLTVCGTVQYGTQYERQFIPAMTKEEYIAKLVLSRDLEQGSVARVAAAMIREVDGENREDFIQQLEQIIGELRGNTKGE